jgi:hypothetical protein
LNHDRCVKFGDIGPYSVCFYGKLSYPISGVVLSFQFGTNWSVFSDKVGNVIGPLLGYEVLTAFFLEASFLGIMLFGWKRVSRRMHFAARPRGSLGDGHGMTARVCI